MINEKVTGKIKFIVSVYCRVIRKRGKALIAKQGEKSKEEMWNLWKDVKGL